MQITRLTRYLFFAAFALMLGLVGGISRTYAVDPPDTTITAAPAAASNSTSASFSFTATVVGSTFECSLDAAAYSACTSPASVTGLAVGAHNFKVRATAAALTDPTPASHDWTVDLTAPQTTINTIVPAVTKNTSQSISFTSSEAGSTFKCSRDGAPFTTCTSPAGYAGLAGGGHTFKVFAVDAATNQDLSPAERAWTVDTTPPTVALTAPADAATISGPLTMTATATDNLSVTYVKFYVRNVLKSTDFSSPYSHTMDSNLLTDGTATVVARAYDQAVNFTDSAVRTVAIDNAPQTTITVGPATLVKTTSATFNFAANQAGSTFECKLDAGAYAACTSPTTITGLSSAAHTYYECLTKPSFEVVEAD